MTGSKKSPSKPALTPEEKQEQAAQEEEARFARTKARAGWPAVRSPRILYRIDR